MKTLRILSLLALGFISFSHAAEPPAELPSTSETETVKTLIGLFDKVEQVTRNERSGALSIHLKGRHNSDVASFQLTFDAQSNLVTTITGNAASITDDELELFANFKELATVTLYHNSNRVKSNPFSGTGLKHLLELPKLASINFSGSTFDNEGLAQAVQLKSLTSFNVWHAKINDEGMAGFRGHPNLQSIRIGQSFKNDLTDLTIENLSECPNLKSLRIAECYVTWENGLRHLVKRKETLATLDLANSLIAPADLEKFKEAMPEVKVLHDGVPVIGAALKTDARKSRTNLSSWAPQELIDLYIQSAE